MVQPDREAVQLLVAVGEAQRYQAFYTADREAVKRLKRLRAFR